jgi:hypothetical protein
MGTAMFAMFDADSTCNRCSLLGDEAGVTPGRRGHAIFTSAIAAQLRRESA